MQTRAIDARNRFRHERGVHVLQLCQLLDHQLGRHQVVGHGEGVGVLQVNLVLTGRAFVVGVLHRYAHLREVEHRFPPQVGGGVAGKLVKVPVVVQQFRRRRILQVEEFQLGPDVVREPHFRRPVQVPPQNLARVAGEGLAPGLSDVAEHPGHGVLARTPGQQREGGRIGIGPHVALVVPGKSVNGRAVEPHAPVQRVLQVVGGDREALELAQDVGEPQANELHVVFPRGPQYKVPCGGCVSCHGYSSPSRFAPGPIPPRTPGPGSGPGHGRRLPGL